jgi:(p)ppGpp synthase/HD superfamily hydrolase
MRMIFSQLESMAASEIEILEKVKAFADNAHGDQMRKYTNERYIVHPIRVMEICQQYTKDVAVLSAALLHDVLEDTTVGRRELGNFLSSIMSEDQASRTLAFVDQLTDVFIKTDYPALNRRARRSREAERLSQTTPEAQTIKYADIIDNTRDIDKDETDFALTYLRECQQLLQNISDGDPELYQLAVNTVNESLREYWKRANVKAL